MDKLEAVAAYIRVSTQEQKLHGLSLDAQRAKLTDYAKSHNMRIVEWYEDEGVSGRKPIKSRPQLQRMIQDAEQRKFSRILFIKLDRFFRSVAEYHECMKRITPVVWTTTEEDYDLTTANGRMLVNMKLTIAELEADQTGERIRIVNDYKVQTGQPLIGAHRMPMGFTIGRDPATGRKNVIHDPETESIVQDALNYMMVHQSLRETQRYICNKYDRKISVGTMKSLFNSSMIHGSYRDNPSYCQPYISKDEFDKLQDILHRNVKKNTAPSRAYLFTGLIRCPDCGAPLSGHTMVRKCGDKSYVYKRYRCRSHLVDGFCSFSKSIYENTFETLMLENVEQMLQDEKLKQSKIRAAQATSNQSTVEEINAQIDRLNYSWQTGKIRTVEQYESRFAALQSQLDEIKRDSHSQAVKDFTAVESALSEGWKNIYTELSDESKRSFWRSIIQEINITWTANEKRIETIKFF